MTSIRRFTTAAVAVLVAGSPSVAAAAPPDPAPAPPVDLTPGLWLDMDAKPALKWSMPDRYQGSWNAYRFSTGTYATDFVNPVHWAINLDACGSRAVRRITGYAFTITQVGTGWNATFTSKQCSTTYRALPALGRYKVSLVLNTDWGVDVGVSRPLATTVTLRDLLVVSMGDSLASGEGNPDKRAGDDGPARWKDSRCHRSALSGPARAAQRLEESDPHTSVTFLSVACSGAKIADVSHRRYGGIDPQTDFTYPAQVAQVAALVGPQSAHSGRPIDALLVSAGVNDLYFSNVIKRCALPSPLGRNCVRWPDRNANLAGLPASYHRLALEIRKQLPTTEKVLLNDYPAYVFKNGGCGKLRGLSKSEGAEMAKVGLKLNSAIANAVARHSSTLYDWRRLPPLTAAFLPHPYCGDSTWFTRLEWSQRNQGDENGTAHPNGPGHRRFATSVHQALAPLLAN